MGEAPPVHPVVLNVVSPGAALHSNHHTNWEKTCHSSVICFCGYLSLLTFYRRTKNLCWIFDGICYLHSGRVMPVTKYSVTKTFSTYTWLGWTRQIWLGWDTPPGYDKGSNFLIFRLWDDRWLVQDSPCLPDFLPDNLSRLAHSANKGVHNLVLIYFDSLIKT